MLAQPRLSAIVEALLVASDDPLPLSELARLIRARIAELEDEALAANSPHDKKKEESSEDYTAEEVEIATVSPELRAFAEATEEDIRDGISELNKDYEVTGRAFLILERAKGWKLYTTPDYGGFVKHLFPGRKPKRLSAPAMETLAVIAYRQPVTKAAIDAVRGVSSDGMLQKLLDLELVKIGGRAELPGRPLLYETTDFFFEHFGITSPDELPNALELRNMDLPDAAEEEEENASEETASDDVSSEDIQQATLAETPPETPEPPEEEPSSPAPDFAAPAPDNKRETS
jgi:segregation and condensation protein B